MLLISKIIRICVGESSLNSVLFFQVRIDTCTLLLSTSGFLKHKGSDTVKLCAQYVYVVF